MVCCGVGQWWQEQGYPANDPVRDERGIHRCCLLFTLLQDRLSPPQPPNGPQDILSMYGQYFFVRTEEGRGECCVSSPGWPSPAITTSPWDTPTKRVALRVEYKHGLKMLTSVREFQNLGKPLRSLRVLNYDELLSHVNGMLKILSYTKRSLKKPLGIMKTCALISLALL
ncbi:hypothetical protein HZH66_003890 [Vespula vulgaris]|uniref:Uncharacterized protein n=1 Tax=Vespula vulgaris TaxID=7454 RepID=A0A834KHQ2_VESVU|nr:hypothetical protein HZH66_003890 [Vespula vulgaris]